MAKTLNSITMDFNNAKRQANALDEVAKKIKEEKKQLSSCRNNIGNVWKSENCKAYQKKSVTVEAELEEIANNLKKTAETIRKIAKTTYDTEMVALEMAKKRSYK